MCRPAGSTASFALLQSCKIAQRQAFIHLTGRDVFIHQACALARRDVWQGDVSPPAPVRRIRPAAREGSPLAAGPRFRRLFMRSPHACLDSFVSVGGPAPSRNPRGSDTGLHEHSLLRIPLVAIIISCMSEETSCQCKASHGLQ